MIKTNVLLLKLSKTFPKRIAKKHHDYVGLMTGKLPIVINNVLLCLDFDEEVYELIKNRHYDLIITHHPFIYGTKSKVFKYDEKKKELCKKIDSLNIPIYSMHTNFDEGINGMNDALLNQLNCQNIYSPIKDPMMRIGELKQPMDISSFVEYVKKAFNIEYGLLINKGNKTIKKVGIIGGGGSRSYNIALEEGADIYISGDAPHHIRREIILRNYNYLDLPHEIEKIFMPTLKNILLKIDSTLKIDIIDHEKEPIVV